MRDNGRDLQPTGRVVAFSNAFVFQPTAGMFKQIPGTNFVWHEITLTLGADSSYSEVEKRMIRAVDAAFASYHEDLERQRVLMETNLGSVSVGPLRPRTALRLTSSGLEVTVSFPVEVHRATEIDDRVTREILREIDREPKLKWWGQTSPPFVKSPKLRIRKPARRRLQSRPLSSSTRTITTTSPSPPLG